MTDNEIRMLLEIISENDCFDSVNWNEDIEFYVNCNDLFWWGSADAEDLNNISDIELFEKSLRDTDSIIGPDLYCARRRKMRPQDPYYTEVLCKENYKYQNLFNLCGPKRENDIFNPNIKEAIETISIDTGGSNEFNSARL